MKVSVLQFFSWPDRSVPLRQVYDRALDRIGEMERTGYDTVWLAEHHFGTYSVCPSVHLMGMAVAERTERLRIGMAVTLAAFYHPLRIAEEVALLDVLSGGRVSWGAGRGFDRTEYQVFGVTPEESYDRFREHVHVVLEAWRRDRLTFHGTYWSFDDVEVLPKPHQRPHPPTWLAATSPDAVRWSGAHAHSILMDPHSSTAELGAVDVAVIPQGVCRRNPAVGPCGFLVGGGLLGGALSAAGAFVGAVAAAGHGDVVGGVSEPVEDGFGDDGVGEQRVPVCPVSRFLRQAKLGA